MSHGVVRGNPAPAQLYLDAILDAVIQDGGSRAVARDGVNVVELLYYCLRTNPGNIHSINAATGEKFTNEQILKRAVSLARTLTATCATERVVFMIRNHEHMSVLYYGVLLAGVVPFMMEPGSTEYELKQFLRLVSPRLIFCEPSRYDDVTKAVRGFDVSVVVADQASLDKFAKGHSDNINDFTLPEIEPESTALILPTSGSTGVPKAALLNHQALVLQIPFPWLHHSQFPQPTPLAILTSTAQWMTHTIVMSSFPIFHVPVLMSPEKITAEYFVEIVGKYRASWAFIGPSLAAAVGHVAAPEQLSSFEKLYVGGSDFSPETLSLLRTKLPAPGCLLNAYGMTEIQGFGALGPAGTPLTSAGPIINILEYKILNDLGKVISQPFEKGEICFRGKCVFKGYLKNEAAYRDCVTPDGWLKTGDIFYQDEKGYVFFANRTKLTIKYLNHHIYPEEVERVIGTVPGVQESVVCGTEAGPAAAVVLQPGSDVTRETIHEAVISTLSDYKRLRGGVVFVSSLPHTHNGKVNRALSLQLIQELIAKGECF